MQIEKYFPHVVSVALLTLGAVQHSAAMAYGAVAVLGFVLAREAWDKAHAEKGVHFALPEDAKRKIQDLEARVTTIEYGIKTRGF